LTNDRFKYTDATAKDLAVMAKARAEDLLMKAKAKYVQRESLCR